MKNHLSSVVVGIGVIVLLVGAWYTVPMLQSPDQIVKEKTGEASERARRLVDGYNAELDINASLVERSGLGELVTSEKINEVVENDAQLVESIVNEETERLEALVKSSRAGARDLDNRMAELAPDESIQQRPAMNLGRNASAMSREMVDGVKDFKAVVEHNDKRLVAALNSVSDGMQITEGDVSGADDLYANRIKGVVLHQQGLSAHRQASFLRQTADGELMDIVNICISLKGREGETGFVKKSGLQELIAEQQKSVAEIESKLEDSQSEVKILRSKIAGLDSAIDKQLVIAEEARKRMEEIESKGLVYEQEDPVGSFRDAYEKNAEIYRQAVSKVQVLENGAVVDAHIDDSGDYLAGDLISNKDGADLEYSTGKVGYERKLAAAQVQMTGQESILADARATLARSEQLLEEYENRAADAGQSVGKSKQEIDKRVEAYNEVMAKVVIEEEKALECFKQAKAVFKAAQRAADARTTNVPAVIPPDSPYEYVQRDRWLGSYASCQAADSEVWAALVLYDRYAHLQRVSGILADVDGYVSTEGIDATEIAKAIEETQDKAEKLLDSAIKTMEGAASGAGRDWSIAASVAGADYVLSLFNHPEMVEAAMNNYDNVVAGREDEPSIRVFKARLEQLRSR